MNVADPIRRLARLDPDATAVIRTDGAKVPFGEFDRLIDAAARSLASLGVSAGWTVGLIVAGPDEFKGLVVALGLARLGAASADANLPPTRMDLFVSEGDRPAKPGVRSYTVDDIWAAMARQPADAPPVPSHPDGAAVFRICSSSGTTGSPKFIPITHAMMTGRVMSNWRNVGGSQAVHICAIGMGTEYGATHMLRTLWSGGALVITNPQRAHADILRHNVVSMVAPAIVLQNIVAALPDGTRPAPSLRVVEVGGSPLPAKLRALTRERLCPWVRSHYGSSETGAIASAPFEALGDAPGAVGYVHAGVAAEIVDEADNVLPPGTEGIVRTRSPHAATGYMDDPDTSARVFRDGWFYSGDVGTLSADGVLTIAGRIGDFINQGGAKVAPSVVEAALLALPQVTEAVAFGAADRMGLTRIWAAIVADGPVPPAALSAHCARTLGDKAPAHVLQLRALPRNANGKILRVELIRFAESQQR